MTVLDKQLCKDCLEFIIEHNFIPTASIPVIKVKFDLEKLVKLENIQFKLSVSNKTLKLDITFEDASTAVHH